MDRPPCRFASSLARAIPTFFSTIRATAFGSTRSDAAHLARAVFAAGGYCRHRRRAGVAALCRAAGGAEPDRGRGGGGFHLSARAAAVADRGGVCGAAGG